MISLNPSEVTSQLLSTFSHSTCVIIIEDLLVFMASSKSDQSRFLGDLPMSGEISEKEKIRYISHLMFFIGCGLFSFGIWAFTGFTPSSGATGPFPF